MHIFKYQIPEGNELSIKMPIKAKILDVQIQNEFVTLWAEVDIHAEFEDRHFLIFGTGWQLPDDKNLHYLKTVQIREFVWHVYEDIKND